jgi:hypothetical protein
LLNYIKAHRAGWRNGHRHVAATATTSGSEPPRDREWWRREAARVGSDFLQRADEVIE